MNMKNTTQLIGYIGVDPIGKETKNEKPYATFSLATHDFYKNSKGEKLTKTLWHNIEVYGELAKRVKTFASKGDQVGLSGKLTYKNKIATIVAAEVLFLKKADKTIKETQGTPIKEAV